VTEATAPTAASPSASPPAPPSALLPELQLSRWHRWAALDRFPAYAAILILAAFLIGLAVTKYGASLSPYSVSTKLGPPPPVEPLILKNVDRATAKSENDKVALTADPVPPAPAFIFRGSPADFERATDCLAATIFYEAGAESAAGQMAVVQVVLNRARHPGYPKSVCGVVFQGHERRTGCQFSYTCDGSMARRPSAEAWARHRGLAAAMLKGLVYPPVGLATHYHTDWVLPVWSARLDKVRVEGTHLFFRYHGYWGSMAAYKTRLSGSEPGFAKLASLSPAHGGGNVQLAAGEDADAVSTDDPAAEIAAMTPPDPERISTTLDTEDQSKEVFLIYVDPLLDSSALTTMAEGACGNRKTCKVFAWADQGLMPRGLPLEPSDRASMAFSYIRTGSTKGSKSANQKWNCELFPRDQKGQCL
jgi:spore germination cell wall hydrolase CwlJ-like protein